MNSRDFLLGKIETALKPERKNKVTYNYLQLMYDCFSRIFSTKCSVFWKTASSTKIENWFFDARMSLWHVTFVICCTCDFLATYYIFHTSATGDSEGSYHSRTYCSWFSRPLKIRICCVHLELNLSVDWALINEIGLLRRYSIIRVASDDRRSKWTVRGKSKFHLSKSIFGKWRRRNRLSSKIEFTNCQRSSYGHEFDNSKA